MRPGQHEKHGLPRVFRIYFRFIMPLDRVRIRVTQNSTPETYGTRTRVCVWEAGGLGFLRRSLAASLVQGGWMGWLVSLLSHSGGERSSSSSQSQSEPSTVVREQRAYYTRVGVLLVEKKCGGDSGVLFPE